MQMDLEELIVSSGDTPASPSHKPGSASARKMTAISGQKCIGSWLPPGPVGSLLKMLLGTSTWASTKCFLTWKVKATPQSRLLFQLAPSTPPTDETASGLLPTPDTQNHRDGTNLRQMTIDAAERGARKGVSLHHHVALWPTPVSSQRGGRSAASIEKGGGITLQQSVKMFPTPTATDGKGSGQNETMRDRLDYIAEKPDGKRVDGSLNPTWVEWLMGFPEGWTDLSVSEMPSSRKFRK